MVKKIDKEEDAFEIMEEIIQEREKAEKEVKEISFLKVCMKCDDLLDNEITDASFKRFLDKNVVVKNYLPLQLKKMWVNLFFMHLESNADFADLTYVYEIYSVLHLLLAYTNINISVDEFTEENYDLITNAGLVDYIKEKCEKDYDRLCKMVINATTFRTFAIIDNFSSNMNFNEAQNVFTETQSALSDIDIDKLQAMRELMEFNNPALTKVKDAIYDETVKFLDKKKE